MISWKEENRKYMNLIKYKHYEKCKVCKVRYGTDSSEVDNRYCPRHTKKKGRK